MPADVAAGLDKNLAACLAAKKVFTVRERQGSDCHVHVKAINAVSMHNFPLQHLERGYVKP